MSLVITESPAEQVVLLRLNRPEARNALSPELREELRDLFHRLGEDKVTRAIVITGDMKAFAAGADIRSMVETSPGEMMQRQDDLNWGAIRHCPKPIIAAVNGYALGGGCELAMHADIIVAGEGARFGQPEIKLGIMPGAGGTQRLVRAVGRYRAMLMLLTGEFMTGTEAFAAGLVSVVTTDEETVARAISIAQTIAGMPPLAAQEIKQVLHAGLDASLDTAIMLERRAAYLLFDSSDKREAMTAFLEKRKALFSGT
jgi:enoyl-CoA hydratase